jgi:hypothetical protein
MRCALFLIFVFAPANGGSQSLADSHMLSNFLVAAAAVATPEPNLEYVFCALLVMAVGRFVLKRN